MKKLLLITVLFFAIKVNAQETKTVYRQTLIIKNNKPIQITWQKVTVNYLDTILQYNKKLDKRRKVLIVFGKEGVYPLSDWIKYEVKEGDTIYHFKRSLTFSQLAAHGNNCSVKY